MKAPWLEIHHTIKLVSEAMCSVEFLYTLASKLLAAVSKGLILKGELLVARFLLRGCLVVIIA